MGPVVGSLAIAQEPVRGFIAVETVGTSWFEYDLERLRVQAAVSGKTPQEVDGEAREYEPCSHRFYVEKEKPESLTQTPACRDFLQPFGAVPYTYLYAGGGGYQPGQAVEERRFSGAGDLRAGLPCDERASKPIPGGDVINRMHPAQATYNEVAGDEP